MQSFKIKMFLSLSLFVILLDLYLWQAIKVLIKKHPIWYQKTIKWVYWSLPVLIVTAFFLLQFNSALASNRLVRTYLMGFFFVIYGSKLIAFLFIVVDDIKRLFIWFWHGIERKVLQQKKQAEEEEMEESLVSNEKKITRSQFIARAGLVAGAVPFVMLSRGLYSGAYNYQVRRVNLVLPNLPEAFDGLKVLQISDVHTGSFFDKDAVYKGIQLIKEQKAHVAVFTGDFVNNKTDEAYEWADMFSEIKAPMGVYSILGNHDYGDYVTDWKSAEEKAKNLTDLYDVHKNMGWNLLRNEHVLLEKENKRIGLLGVENWGDRGRFQRFGDIDKAKAGMPNVPVKILLSHDPSHFDTIVSKQHPDIDLTLSGHTHGFQFGVEFGHFKWSPSQYIYPHWADLYKIEKQMLYVNRGFGFLGYPGRVGILPEITVFTLNRMA
jgi:predicted MPP superfamily phosphohydrolase